MPKRGESLLQLLPDGRQRQSLGACLQRLLGQVDHRCHGRLGGQYIAKQGFKSCAKVM
jgi:hypothetical protein